MSKRNIGSGNSTGSKMTQFKLGHSGNSKGRPKRQASTFESEVRTILNKMMSVTIDGKVVEVSKRQLLIEQVINLAIKGNPTMARLAIPLLKIADEHPQLEVRPEDEAVLKELMLQFDR